MRFIPGAVAEPDSPESETTSFPAYEIEFMSSDPLQTPSPVEHSDAPIPTVEPEASPLAPPASPDGPASADARTATSAAASQTPNSTPATADGAPPTAPHGAIPEEAGQKRRLRLNPTVVPEALRPVPNLSAAEAAAAGTAAPVPTPAAAPEAPEAAEVSAAAPVTPPLAAPPPGPKPPPVAIPRHEELDADLEAQIAAAMPEGVPPAPPVAAPAEEGAAPVTEETLAAGAKLKGTIQSVTADSVFVDVGLRTTALIPLRQFDPKHPPQVGAGVTVTVDKVDEAEGLIHCNLPRGRGKVSHDWSAVVVGQTVECNVTSTNKGGLEVTVGSLRGFLPASQVELGFAANMDSYVGQRLSVRVTEVNPARRRLIVSRRVLLAEERQANESTLLDQIQPGQVRSGVVKSLKDFGAFVDLGGIDGFLHVGQISWQRINKPSDVLSEGQGVEVKVLTVDREKKRIGLSLRQMEQNPWGTAEAKYAKGSHVTGRVSRIEAFGAFIELEPGVEGLVHISELDHKRVRAVGDVLSLNQMVELQVLEVDPRKRRISLSAKALKEKPEEAPREAASAAPPPPERKSKANLKGGIGGPQKGGLFGDPRQFS